MRIATLYTLCTIALAAMMLPEASAQELPATATGRMFVLTFPKTLDNLFDERAPGSLYGAPELTAMIYADRPTQVYITRNSDGWFKSITIDPDTVVSITLPTDKKSYVSAEGVSSNTFTIRSRHPVLVYCHMASAFGSEAWAPLPVESWGTDYYAAAIPAEVIRDVFPESETTYRTHPKGAPSQVMVVAARDNTHVFVEPSCTLAGDNNPKAKVIRLDAGETYAFQSDIDLSDPNGLNGPDMGGTLIRADNIVGVVSGNLRAATCSPATISQNSFKGMLIEALAPVEQHGTEFVFMPTLDGQQLQPGDDRSETGGKRLAEYARVYGSFNGTTYGATTDSSGTSIPFDVLNSDVHGETFDYPTAHVIRTDQPAQVMMHSSAVVKFNGTATWPNIEYVGAIFKTWSPYMVELTPREQWTSAAVAFAPLNPAGIRHRLSVVTSVDHQDDVRIVAVPGGEDRFDFNQGHIPGSDLVWGTLELAPGATYKIIGGNGATFGGYVYGTRSGHEAHRPGGTWDDGDSKGTGIAAMHPSEYEEDIAISYGYPLSPKRSVLGKNDRCEIRQDLEDPSLYHIILKNSEPIGLRSVDVTRESVNAEIAVQGVDDIVDIVGSDRTSIRLSRLNPNKIARGTIMVTDRTGQCYTTEFLMDPSVTGVREPNSTAGSFDIAGPNPTSGSTWIDLNLRQSGATRITLVDGLGRVVKTVFDGEMTAGTHTLGVDGYDLPAGIYFCRVAGGGWADMKKLVIR